VFAGKRLLIGQAEYEIGGQIQEGNGAQVHPLRNLMSGYTWSVGRFSSQARKAAEVTAGDRFREVDFRTFVMALGGFPVVQTETHDVPGGTVQVRRAMAASPEDAYYGGLMRQASELCKSGRWEEARQVYSDVLSRNSSHHLALLGLTACLLNLNDAVEALRIITKAPQVEPNDSQVHRQIAVVFRSLSMAEPALQALEHNLQRFRWDAPSWRLKAKIGREYGVAQPLEQMIAEFGGLAPDRDSALGKFLEELQAGLNEAQGLATRFMDAIEKQHQSSWTAALEVWEAVGQDHLHSVNQVNVLICKFHLGRTGDVAKEALPLLYCLPVPLHKLTCVGLGLVSNATAGNIDFALRLARLLSSEVTNPADLPGIPQVIFPGGEVNESPSSQRLIQALEWLSKSPSAAEDVTMLASLIRLYREREQNFSGAGPSAPEARPRWWKFW